MDFSSKHRLVQVKLNKMTPAFWLSFLKFLRDESIAPVEPPIETHNGGEDKVTSYLGYFYPKGAKQILAWLKKEKKELDKQFSSRK